MVADVKWLRIFKLLILSYIFFLAIGLMSDSFKLMGEDLAKAVLASTSNPLMNIMLGILATTVVQSSSLTTFTTMGLVTTGAIEISGAVFVIMGANIGTTVTNTIVSIGYIENDKEFKSAFAAATVHDIFNLLTVAALFPIELMTGFLQKSGMWLAKSFAGATYLSCASPVKVITAPVVALVHSLFIDYLELPEMTSGILIILLALFALFVSLLLIGRLIRSFNMEKLRTVVHKYLGINALSGIIVGLAITAIFRSSSMTTSLLIPLAASGAMNLGIVFSATMGANIGTTITALLAALGDPNGMAIAFVHLLLNFTGVVVFALIPKVKELAPLLAKYLAEWVTEKRERALGYIAGVFYVFPFIAYILAKILYDRFLFI